MAPIPPAREQDDPPVPLDVLENPPPTMDDILVPLGRPKVDAGKIAEELAQRLEQASHELVDRLFDYLSRIPAEHSRRKRNQPGLTLPASAIGWLATQIYDISTSPLGGPATPAAPPSEAWMGASMRDRISLLKYLLPRATHLRIVCEEWPPVYQKRKKRSNRSTVSFVGRDVDMSHLSVHSGVTMETVLPGAPPDIPSFLLFYSRLQHCPRVDLRVFSNLSVLLLEQVPADWVTNLPPDLRLFRLERASVFRLGELLQTVEEPKLTHLKLTHAALGEMSGLRGRRRRKQKGLDNADTDPLLQPLVAIPPPLSRLTNLVSLCLSHNEIRTVKTALAGLSALSNLQHLDLSFNRIATFANANRMIGNVKTLDLTGNALRNVTGIDKLYSLEALHLNENQFQEITDVASLGNLPELMALYLKENPLFDADPIRYRVQVLDLFKSKRFNSLLPGATYRHLLQILPVLDGSIATKRELVGLRSLTFHQNVPIVESGATICTEVTLPETPAPSVQSEQQPLQQLTPILTPKRVTRVTRKRRVVVRDDDDENPVLTSNNGSSSKPRVLPKIQFSAQDVIAKTTPSKKKVAVVSLEALPACRNLSFVSVSTVQDSDSCHDIASEIMGENYNVSLLDNYSAASLIPRVKKTPKTQLSGDIEDDTAVTNGFSGSPSRAEVFKTPPIKEEETDEKNVSFGSQQYTSSKNERKDCSTNPFDNQAHVESLAKVDTTTAASDDDSSCFPKATVEFPELVWDTLSIQSSIGNVSLAADDKYRRAETETVYDGPDRHRKLTVRDNLELYYKVFVFSTRTQLENPNGSMQLDDDEEITNLALQAAPRIQMRPIDRKVAEKSAKDTIITLKHAGESFKKVGAVKVVACGKSAARRVTPHKKLRRGFRGEPVFVDGAIQFGAECRNIILCTSNAAIYLIPEYDPVTVKAMERNHTRKFPSPVPQTALFKDGAWPHCLARLPSVSLNRITIGFSFQRLTLHFCPSSTEERQVLGNVMTYILATSNRVRTVELLQQLQDLAKETEEFAGGKRHDLVIDNDDAQVLDALAVAVAPCSVDVVLHYQVLEQQWKHGDRGTVRRACVLTDTHIFLLDEDYVGDGSESFEAGTRALGDIRYSLIDSAETHQIVEVQAASDDPRAITIVNRPSSRLSRNHNWRLVCQDGDGAERLVDDVRKAMAMAESTLLGVLNM